VIAEGAGALAVAAALSGLVPGRKLVCIVSGGNIDAARLATILGGDTPD
jgi:threonine dehydratase